MNRQLGPIHVWNLLLVGFQHVTGSRDNTRLPPACHDNAWDEVTNLFRTRLDIEDFEEVSKVGSIGVCLRKVVSFSFNIKMIVPMNLAV